MLHWPIIQIAICFPATIIGVSASIKPKLVHFSHVDFCYFPTFSPIALSELMQFNRPFSVCRISLQTSLKLLGLVMGSPTIFVIDEATPVTFAKASYIFLQMFNIHKISKIYIFYLAIRSKYII